MSRSSCGLYTSMGVVASRQSVSSCGKASKEQAYHGPNQREV